MRVEEIMALLAMFLAVPALAVIYIVRVRALRASLLSNQQLWRQLISVIDSRLSLEEALVKILDVVGEMVEARGYYFYLREGRQDSLVLKVVKRATANVEVGPSYSGLISSDEEVYNPPLGLSLDAQPGGVAMVRERGVYLLSIPLWGPALVGVIHAGPLAAREVSSRRRQALAEIASLCAIMVSLLVERDSLKRRVDELSAMSQVSATMMRSAFGIEGVIGLFLYLGSSLAGADGGLVMLRGEAGEVPWITVSWGLPEEARGRLEREASAFAGLLSFSGAPAVMVAEGGLKSLPAPLIALGAVGLWVVPFTTGGRKGALVYWFKSMRKMEGYLRAALEEIARRIASAFQHTSRYEETLQSYLETLKSIVALLDSEQPCTVNHSRLIAKYAKEISLALGLPREQLEGVSLAAYLHDVGMVGLDEAILFKHGKLTAVEYERVKGHTQLGGIMVAPLTRPFPLAPLVRHHHERFDGWGYPDGLKGEEIPLGARIIAVADVFNAKVTARGYREALPYEKAIAGIKAAAGSHLDPVVVEAFVRLWEARQKQPGRRGKALEECWVMQQCPERIGVTCPAYHRGSNCWETSNVQCHLHGSVCESCLVYTEYKFRHRIPGPGG